MITETSLANALGAGVAAVGQASSSDSGHRCLLLALGTTARSLGVASQAIDSTGSDSAASSLSSEFLTRRAVFRLVVTNSETVGAYDVNCRVDYGVAVGAATLTTSRVLPPGQLGVQAFNARVEIKAFAAYQQPAGGCVDTIVR
jgi:hypothetical protein